NENTTQAQIVQLAGEGKRVLVLGNADNSLLRPLREQGCDVVSTRPAAVGAPPADDGRVLVTGLDGPDPARELGEETFDVIVAANVLEYLRDPLAVLKSLKKHLRQESYVVALVPNVA